jgi:hypothetical protein
VDTATVRPFLVARGQEKRFLVATDREGVSISATRLVEPGELDVSVGVACRLGLISPDGVCRSLSAKASSAAAATKRGNREAARGVWRAFLQELAGQGGKHVQEPALTILREEAEALLNPVPAMPIPAVKAKPKPRGKKLMPGALPRSAK